MARVDNGPLTQARAAQRVHGAGHRWLPSLLLGMIALTAITAVVVATAMGQPTVAYVIGLLTAAVFAGIVC